MGAPTVTTEEFIELFKKLGSPSLVAKEIGISVRCVHQRRTDLMSKLGIDIASWNDQRNKDTQAARKGYSPQHDMIHTVPDGFLVKGVSTLYAQGKVAAQWVKSQADEDRQREIQQAAYEAMAEELPRLDPVKPPESTIDSLCNLAVFTDYHIGALAWGKETGEDWDLKIAEQLLLDSFMHMVNTAPQAKTLILCLQGDTLHADSILPVTPQNKNILDTDGRFSKVIAIAIRVIRRLVDHALSRHEVVHLIICEGNHDETSSIWMRHMFTALYEQEPRLTVNDSELPYYVHQHGNVMLGFHHGHKVKNEALPMIFAAQYPQIWGTTTKRYCHTGHRHHVDEKEYAGMTVTQHPTLTARDAYAARGGWISERAAQVVTYHKRYGQVARTVVCPEMFEATA